MRLALLDFEGKILESHGTDEFAAAVAEKLTAGITGLRAQARKDALTQQVRTAFHDVEVEFKQRSVRV